MPKTRTSSNAPQEKKKEATIVQVANLAGVSFKTVSRVVNKESGVKAKTRDKVIRAINKLNYQPTQSARIMRTKKSGILGLITSAITHSGSDPGESGLSSIHIVRGVQQACHELGLKLMISDTDGDPNEIQNLLQIFHSYQVEGIIATADRLLKVDYPLNEELPTILVNCFDDKGTPSLIPNDLQGQMLATRYLIENNHRRIGFLGLPEDNIAYPIRKKGFIETCQKMGLNQSDYAYIPGGFIHTQSVFEKFDNQLETLIHSTCKPTAIMFGNDIMALRGTRYFLNHSIKIPEQISMVGFDNDVRICMNLTPTLSTIMLPYYRMGYLSVYRLRDYQSLNRGEPEQVDCELIIRNSSKKTNLQQPL